MLSQTILGQWVTQIKGIDANDLWVSAINDSVTNQMKDLNIDQLDSGLYADNTPTPDYSPYTSELKIIEGKKSDQMNFDDTGETRASIKYTTTSYGIRIDIEDRFDLLKEYSEEIIGLTDKSKEFISDEIIENIQEEIIPSHTTLGI